MKALLPVHFAEVKKTLKKISLSVWPVMLPVEDLFYF